jgi:hypothetical protein
MATSDFSAVDKLIQEVEDRFNKIKLEKASTLQDELLKINPETDSLKTKVYTKLDELAQAANTDIQAFKKELDDLFAEITNTLGDLTAGNKPVVKAEIETLKQKTKDLVAKIIGKLDELAAGQDLSELKLEINSWAEKINTFLDGLLSTSEENQKIDLLIADAKTNLVQPASSPELDEASTLNKRINDLIEKTQTKVAELLPELDKEVQGELGKLIKVLGTAQIELEKDSNSHRVIQVKTIVDDVGIAIDSLTGKPNLVLAQKLRYASKSRLRKMQGGVLRTGADWRDDIFHAIKTPTKVLLGVVLAVPLSWLIIDCVTLPPVKDLLRSLPTLEASTSPIAVTPSPSPTSELKPIDEETLNFVILLLMTGTLGGVVSILTRIQEFDNPKTQKYEDDFLPFLIGLIKPILGGSFAFFIFLLLNSGVSPIEIKGKGTSTSTYFYGFLALAFISGFSERFVPDLISQVEKTSAPSKPPEQGQGLQPTKLKIDPPTAALEYKGTQDFTLNPPLSDGYDIVLTSDKEGDKGKTEKNDPGFVYTAPTKDEAKDITKVTITVTSNTEPKQSATATVTLTTA